jgi:glucosamine-6-phosphate deaminase
MVWEKFSNKTMYSQKGLTFIMQLVIANNYDHMSELGAEMIIKQLSDNSRSVLGLATGGTPLGVYQRLRDQDKGLFAQVTTFNLDEYIGISPQHPNSYRSYMRQELFDAVGIPEQRAYLPYGSADDVQLACSRYEQLIVEHGGIDLQLLGIGTNGHIGFNEPGTPFDSQTHKVQLKEETRLANQRYFDRIEDVPTHAITMGIGTILRSKKIVLLVSGASKREALRLLLSGEATPDMPATSLHSHPSVTIIADKEALES